MSSKEGIEITIALQEINEICGVIFDTECSTQQGFIQLASYLQHRPDYNKLFVSSLKSAGYDLPGMVKEAIAAQQAQIEKVNANNRPAAAAKVNYRIEENKQYNSKEIYFDRIPSKATREALKKLKFRWHNLKKCWYGFATLEAIKAAC